MRNHLIITSGKLLSFAIRKTNLGNGSTWPGHLALRFNKQFIKDILKASSTKVVFVVGTNGKTTTTSLIRHLLYTQGYSVIHNLSGANLLNGIASTLLLNSTATGKVTADVALFEIDENVFSHACQEVKPDIVVILNLFRDQLDRYGEVNSIALKWQKTLNQLPEKTQIILSADDPQIAFLGKELKQKTTYFGLAKEDGNMKEVEHAADTVYCPRCGNKLTFTMVFYSHLGIWNCSKCHLTRPKDILEKASSYPLLGTYNKINTHAAVAAADALGVSKEIISEGLLTFTPALGRQEEIVIRGKKTKLFLVKNPTGFNETLRTILKLRAHHVLCILNDRIADGTDVSWIWDVDFEMLQNENELSLTLSGDRVYDLGLRLKYAELPSELFPSLEKAVATALAHLPQDEILYILPTYTAMLEVRKILTGKSIL